MAASITTYMGMRCTKIARTQFFTTTSTSAATETAGLPVIVSSVGTSVTDESSITSATSSVSRPTDSTSTSSITARAATLLGASNTLTAALQTTTSSNTDPLSTQISGDGASGQTSDDSKKDIIAAAIGASMGAVAVVGLVILCAYMRRRKRRSIAATSPHVGGREKQRNGNSILGQFWGLTKPISRSGRRLKATFIYPIPAIVTRIRDYRSTTENDHIQQDESLKTQPESMENGKFFTRQSSGVSGEMPRPVNPFADPPSNGNPTTNENNSRPENPFADHTEPLTTWADYSKDNPNFLPLTVRNADVGSDDNHDNNTAIKGSNAVRRSTLSGSTLNLSNGRASSPIVPDFKARIENWQMNRKPEDRTSTYSDPFDLDRPPTIHSSIHPTPMVEDQYRQEYFA